MTDDHNARTTHGIVQMLISILLVPIPLAVIVGVIRVTKGLSKDPVQSWLIWYLTTVVLPILLLVGVAIATTAFVRWTEGYIRG